MGTFYIVIKGGMDMHIDWSKHDEIICNMPIINDEVLKTNIYTSRLVLIRDREEEEIQCGNYITYRFYFQKKKVGLILCNVSEDYLYIESLEVEEEERRKGYAKEVLLALESEYNYPTIVGTAVPGSIDFWNSLGASLCENLKAEEPNFLIPFELKIS